MLIKTAVYFTLLSIVNGTVHAEHSEVQPTGAVGSKRFSTEDSNAQVSLETPSDLTPLVGRLNSNDFRTRMSAQRQIEQLVLNNCATYLSHIRRMLRDPILTAETRARLSEIVNRARPNLIGIVNTFADHFRRNDSVKMSQKIGIQFLSVFHKKAPGQETVRRELVEADSALDAVLNAHKFNGRLSEDEWELQADVIAARLRRRTASSAVEDLNRNYMKHMIEQAGFTAVSGEFNHYFVKPKNSNRLFEITFLEGVPRLNVQELHPFTKAPLKVAFSLSDLLSPLQQACMVNLPNHTTKSLLKISAPTVSSHTVTTPAGLRISVEGRAEDPNTFTTPIADFLSEKFPFESQNILASHASDLADNRNIISLGDHALKGVE